MTSTVYFFPNGNTMFFDEHGEQMPELQQSWLILYLKFLEEKGIDPTNAIEFNLPNGMQAKPFVSDAESHWPYRCEIKDGKHTELQWAKYTERKRLASEDE